MVTGTGYERTVTENVLKQNKAEKKGGVQQIEQRDA